jgi:hypothetical protein
MFRTQRNAIVFCLSTLVSAAAFAGAGHAQGAGFGPWQYAAYNLNGCGDCAMNGVWGLHEQYLPDLGITISMESMNLGCCYAGAWIGYSVPSSWQGLCADGPPPFVKLVPSVVGPTPGGVVFRNFSAIAGVGVAPTGPGEVHGILGGGSYAYQCPSCSGIWKQEVPVGMGMGEHLVRVAGAKPQVRLVAVDDSDPDRPSVGFELEAAFDNVAYSFDGKTFDLGAMGPGSFSFQMPSILAATPAVHGVTLRATQGQCTAFDVATLDISWMQTQVEKDWTVVPIPGMGWKGVRAVAALDKRRCEWSLPGAVHDRILMSVSIVVGSEIPVTPFMYTQAAATFTVSGIEHRLRKNPSGLGVTGKWSAGFGDGSDGDYPLGVFAATGSTVCTMWVGGRTTIHFQGSVPWSLSEELSLD